MLMKVLKVNEGTLRYHLHELEKKEMIREKKMNSIRCYNPVCNSHLGNDLGIDPGTCRVLSLIRDEPGISRKDLLMRSGMGRDGLTASLQKLKSKGLIAIDGRGNGSAYEPMSTRRLKKELTLILTEKFVNDEIDLETFKRSLEKIKDG
jgi:predicted transcriptional regulator